jgi:hypothetical protein
MYPYELGSEDQVKLLCSRLDLLLKFSLKSLQKTDYDERGFHSNESTEKQNITQYTEIINRVVSSAEVPAIGNRIQMVLARST